MRSKLTTAWYNAHCRDERSKTFYQSAAWRALRDYKLARDVLCEVCRLNDVIEPADLAHHIIPITTALGWEHRLDLTFLQSLCHQCHNQIESEIDRERAGRLP